MASRCFNNTNLTLEREVVKLWAEVAIGASGAPTLTRGKGISSVAGGTGATATGLYTFTLEDKYVRLLKASGNVLRVTGHDLKVDPGAKDVSSAKTIVMNVTAAGSLADPSASDILYVEFELLNSAT